MTELIESDDCRQGFHFECRACPCPCHPRSGQPAPVWDPTVATRTSCSGTTWTADRAAQAY